MRSLLCLVLITFSLVNANVFYDLSKEEYNKVKDSRNFTGKVVLVTGSSSGIGEGIVKLFSLLGAQVVVTARKAADVKRVAQEVQQLSPQKLKVRIPQNVCEISKFLDSLWKLWGTSLKVQTWKDWSIRQLPPSERLMYW